MKDADIEREARFTRLFWIGVIGAVLVALTGIFGAHAGSVRGGPMALQRQVEAALAGAGYPGLEVRMDGQRAVLNGVVESPQAVAAVQRVALRAAGAGGLWAGGVTRADISGVEVGLSEHPFAWKAIRRERRLVLSGVAPSKAARAALMSEAAASLPNTEAIDEMRVAGGAPSPNWTFVARDALKQLANVSSGEARLVDDQIVILGDASGEAAEALRQHYRTPPPPFRARVDVTIDGASLAAPELQGLDLNAGDADVCGEAFTRLMARNVINFAPGSAEIDHSSQTLLDQLASVALRCDRFTIEAAGHTDNQGGRFLNMELSQRRAEAVVSYLASQGVARDRLRAVGYGPDRPRAPNATPAGQAANRRIEFTVSS